MEDDLKKIMEMEDDLHDFFKNQHEDLEKNERQPEKQNGRRPKTKWKTISTEKSKKYLKIKMEYNLKQNFKKSTLIGCDIIVN